MPKIGIYFDAVMGHLATRLMVGIFRYTNTRPEIQLLKSSRGIYLDRNTPPSDLAKADGFLAFSEASTIGPILETKKPVYNMSGSEKREDGTVFDDDAVGRVALDYLHSKSLAAYGCIHRSGDHSSRLRRLAFADEASARGLNHSRLPFNMAELKEEYVEISDAFKSEVISWLNSQEKPFGLFCSDDFVARTVSDVCRAASILVPEEVCIIGVNNDPEQCLAQSPHLSSIDLDFESLAFHSMRHLIRDIDNQHSDDITYLRPLGVTSRQSTDYIDSDSQLIRRAIRWIKSQCCNMIHAEDVAQHLGVSRQYLNRKLKQEVGLTITDCIRREKIVHTKNLLSKTTLSLEKIVEQCGYSDLNQLLRQFRKEAGETPTQFRRKLVHREMNISDG